jgi:tetratricopeptide (TPR) repeat protein
MYPGSTGPDSPYRRLAVAYRELKLADLERDLLTRYAVQDEVAPEAYLRLMELGSAAGDWRVVLTNAHRYLAVNPLVAPPYRYLAKASEATGDRLAAISACRVLLRLDPPNPAEVRYQLARLLHQQNDPEAKKHVIQALEDAPRFRDALRLLRELQAQPEKPLQTTAIQY